MADIRDGANNIADCYRLDEIEAQLRHPAVLSKPDLKFSLETERARLLAKVGRLWTLAAGQLLRQGYDPIDGSGKGD